MKTTVTFGFLVLAALVPGLLISTDGIVQRDVGDHVESSRLLEARAMSGMSFRHPFSRVFEVKRPVSPVLEYQYKPSAKRPMNRVLEYQYESPAKHPLNRVFEYHSPQAVKTGNPLVFDHYHPNHAKNAFYAKDPIMRSPLARQWSYPRARGIDIDGAEQQVDRIGAHYDDGQRLWVRSSVGAPNIVSHWGAIRPNHFSSTTEPIHSSKPDPIRPRKLVPVLNDYFVVDESRVPSAAHKGSTFVGGNLSPVSGAGTGQTRGASHAAGGSPRLGRAETGDMSIDKSAQLKSRSPASGPPKPSSNSISSYIAKFTSGRRASKPTDVREGYILVDKPTSPSVADMGWTMVHGNPDAMPVAGRDRTGSGSLATDKNQAGNGHSRIEARGMGSNASRLQARAKEKPEASQPPPQKSWTRHFDKLLSKTKQVPKQEVQPAPKRTLVNRIGEAFGIKKTPPPPPPQPAPKRTMIDRLSQVLRFKKTPPPPALPPPRKTGFSSFISFSNKSPALPAPPLESEQRQKPLLSNPFSKGKSPALPAPTEDPKPKSFLSRVATIGRSPALPPPTEEPKSKKNRKAPAVEAGASRPRRKRDVDDFAGQDLAPRSPV